MRLAPIGKGAALKRLLNDWKRPAQICYHFSGSAHFQARTSRQESGADIILGPTLGKNASVTSRVINV